MLITSSARHRHAIENFFLLSTVSCINQLSYTSIYQRCHQKLPATVNFMKNCSYHSEDIGSSMLDMAWWVRKCSNFAVISIDLKWYAFLFLLPVL